MSTNRDFRFTVEQIWLLQRLRGSGLSRDQIVAGLEDLDRLDGAGSTPSPFTGKNIKMKINVAQKIFFYRKLDFHEILKKYFDIWHEKFQKNIQTR